MRCIGNQNETFTSRIRENILRFVRFLTLTYDLNYLDTFVVPISRNYPVGQNFQKPKSTSLTFCVFSERRNGSGRFEQRSRAIIATAYSNPYEGQCPTQE